MRRLTMIVLLAALVSPAGVTAATCPPPQSTQLTGLWESEDKSKGGIGHAIELRADGSYSEATTVIVDMVYRVSGDQIFLSEKPGGEEKPIPLDLGAETPNLEKRLGPSVGRKERVGQREPGQEPIVGVWRYEHPTLMVAFERYLPDGRMQLRLPMRSSKGCYASDGTKLTLTQNRQETKASFGEDRKSVV